ncbi:MAG: hypothetical protein HY063_03290 [Bacteroidetes bacterium]|nr:hypothetical protein [Bacteroidota bacterium]
MKQKALFALFAAVLFAFQACEKCIECKYKSNAGDERVAHHCGKGNDSYKQQFQHEFCDTAKNAASCGCVDVSP